mgnify:CR=1 FL=1
MDASADHGDDADTTTYDESEIWLALRCRVSEGRKDLLSSFLFDLGSRGLTEDHPGLDVGDDGPLVSGDPTDWSPPVPDSPDGFLVLTGWFLGAQRADELVAATSARMSELGIDGIPAVERVLPQDWNAGWKRNFEAFRVSPRLWIVPTWEEPPASTAGSEVLRLDPGMAFGTGTHFTTSACMKLIDAHVAAQPTPTVLDVGTGSGLLALGALLLGVPHAIGVDTSPEAIVASNENAALNELSARFDVIEGGIDAAPPGTHPLVVANLLAGLLIDLAPQLARRLAPGGRLVVSGVLRRQEDDVVAALTGANLRVADALRSDDWVALALEHA